MGYISGVKDAKGGHQMRRKWAIAAILSLTVLVTLAVLFHGQLNRLRTLATLRRIDNFPLYEMRYYGDYEFENFLQMGMQALRGLQSYQRETNSGWACTCFAALDREGDSIFGRNFDWYLHPALILFTNPPGGYASVSMVDISYLGYGNEDPSWFERRRLLYAPYLPFDGMNECGLAVGILAVPYAEGGEDPNKVTIGGLQAVRLMLDYAKDVDQAILLLGDYNIDFRGGPPLHYLVADSSGNSAVVEFINGQMSIIRNREQWQVATNFVISHSLPVMRRSHCWRYSKAYEVLEQAEGNISGEEAMALLNDVAQSGAFPTGWSAVYNMTSGDIEVAMGREYSEPHEFTLEVRHAF
jgi:hypothetical protein